jgi:hypothetical protein
VQFTAAARTAAVRYDHVRWADLRKQAGDNHPRLAVLAHYLDGKTALL